MAQYEPSTLSWGIVETYYEKEDLLQDQLTGCDYDVVLLKFLLN